MNRRHFTYGYYVCVGSFEQRHSRRLYDRRSADRLARRARRLGLDAYVSSPVKIRLPKY